MNIQSVQQSDYYYVPGASEQQVADVVAQENRRAQSSATTFSGLQKELSQILANVQPPSSVKETAQRQLQDGRLDIKI